MEFNSYNYYQYEVKLAKIIQTIVDKAKQIEEFKLTYIKHVKFDAYETFLTIDEDKQKFISSADFLKFLRRNNISVKQKEIEFLIDNYSSAKSILFFKDFLKLILPQGDEDMLDNIVKQSLSAVKQQGMRISPLIEHKISELIDIEIKMVKHIESMKINLAEEYFWSYKLALEVLMKGREGQVTPEILLDFMQINGDSRYKFEDFKYLKFRYSRFDALSMLTQQEFGNMVYPYEFFVDKNDDIYENYKSKEQEEEEEKEEQKKQQDKEEFDKKFKIIGDFIKDPEYYVQQENIIKYFEENKYRKLYKDLKDFDFYVQFAKDHIVVKKEEEKEQKQVLDFYETIRQHQKDAQDQKNKNKKQGEEDLFDISNMVRLKDYKKQLKYETPHPPMQLKQFFKLIKADRNFFYYGKDDIKIDKRMKLFETIRQDMKKQDLRKKVLDNKIEEIKVNEKADEEIDRRRLFGAFSTYTFNEDLDLSSPRQTSPYKTYLYKSLKEKQKNLQNLSFGEVIVNLNTPQRRSSGGRIIKAELAYEDKIIERKPHESPKQTETKSQKSQITIQDTVKIKQNQSNSFIIDQRSGRPSKSSLRQSPKSKFDERPIPKQISFNEFVDGYSEKSQSELDEKENIKVATSTAQKHKMLINITQKGKIQKQKEEISQQPTVKKVAQKKVKQDIIKQARSTVIQFQLIHAQRRQDMCKKIIDKTNFGDYKNLEVYQKYYQ